MSIVAYEARRLDFGPSHHIAPDATAHAPATHSTADPPTAAEAASLFDGALILSKRLERVQLTGRWSSLSGGAVGDEYCGGSADRGQQQLSFHPNLLHL